MILQGKEKTQIGWSAVDNSMGSISIEENRFIYREVKKLDYCCI